MVMVQLRHRTSNQEVMSLSPFQVATKWLVAVCGQVKR